MNLGYMMLLAETIYMSDIEKTCQRRRQADRGADRGRCFTLMAWGMNSISSARISKDNEVAREHRTAQTLVWILQKPLSSLLSCRWDIAKGSTFCNSQNDLSFRRPAYTVSQLLPVPQYALAHLHLDERDQEISIPACPTQRGKTDQQIA